MNKPSGWIHPPYWAEACAELSARDEVLAELIAGTHGELLGSHGDPFVTLARAIVGQQVSVLAADRLWARLSAALGGSVTPEAVLAADGERLRSAGLSARKVEYLHDLAHRLQTGRLHPEAWPLMSDEEVVAELTAVRGIGRWTAEMVLIFHLLRPDVWPADDLGLRRALVARYPIAPPQSLRGWRALGEQFRPWRTVATWYLWRSLDPVAVVY